MVKSATFEVKSVSEAEVEALETIYETLRRFGSFDPAADLSAIMGHHTSANLALKELYRVLMEPVFRYQETDTSLAVTVFRPNRTLRATEVYNWLHHFKCYDCDEPYSDAEYVLDPELHDYWHISDYVLRGARLFFLSKDMVYQDGLGSGEEIALEYVLAPDSLDRKDLVRTGDTSCVIHNADLVITSGFPEDPFREYHGRRLT